MELTRLEGAASGSADEDPLSATAVQVVRAQLLEWDAAVLSGTRVAYAFALPSAGTAVEAVHRTQFGGVLRAAGQCEGGALGPMRARKTKRMDRRLTHWQCTFCRHETAVSEQVNTSCSSWRVSPSRPHVCMYVELETTTAPGQPPTGVDSQPVRVFFLGLGSCYVVVAVPSI